MSNPMFRIPRDKEISVEILRDSNEVLIRDLINNTTIKMSIDDLKTMYAFVKIQMTERVSK